MKREFFSEHALWVAPQLLGAQLTVSSDEGTVAVRVTEVEAYHGVGTPEPYDPGSHARDRRTERNASMFGPPGHVYVYFTYGLHHALNIVCSPEGIASGVLIRAGEVILGEALARTRRREKRNGAQGELQHRTLARGPGNIATVLGLTRDQHDGRDLFTAPFRLALNPVEATHIRTGPRVGVAGVAGGPDFPWRFWVSDDRTVSAFRAGRGAPRD